MLITNTNLSSMIAQRNLGGATKNLNTSIERMTTGYKINKAKDNAANYSISKGMSCNLSSMMMAEENVAQGKDLVSTATGILSGMQDKANRLVALSTQARNGTYGATSLAAINDEANALIAEPVRQYNTAEYNNVNLFNQKSGGTPDGFPKVGESGFIDTTAMPNKLEAGASGFIDESFTKVGTTGKKTLVKAVADGDTIKNGTWKISDVNDLKKLAEIVNAGTDTTGATFVLEDDIHLTGIDWTPIGTSSNKFKGTFEGNGHKIYDLTISSTEDYQGLFGDIDGGKIRNVGLENVDVTGKNYVGGLVGIARNSSSVTNSYAIGSVTGNYIVGGLVGSADSSSVTNSYATGSVTGTVQSAGGLVGSAEGSSVTNSYATGNVVGELYVGGLVGVAQLFCSVTNSYATGNVEGNNYVGGLVGLAQLSCSVTNSYATGSVTGRGNSVGGLVGSAYAFSVTNSYATGNVEGNNYVGGLAGYAEGSSVTNSYATGNIVGDKFVGGFAGMLTDITGTTTLKDCISTGTASGNEGVGSFIGGICNTDGTDTGTIDITNCAALKNSSIIGGTYKYDGGFVAYDFDMTDWLNGITEYEPPQGITEYGPQQVITTTLQVGINSDFSSHLIFNTNFDFDFDSLKGGMENAATFDAIENLLNVLNEQQTKLGSIQNRLDSVLEEISINIENLTSTRSTLRDTDIADESSAYIRNQILQQASATLLATANQIPSTALQLL